MAYSSKGVCIQRKEIPIFNRIFADFHKSEIERSKRKRKIMAKLLSSTENTSVQLTPDGVSIVFQSIKQGHTIHWPASGWLELKQWIDWKVDEARIKHDTNNRLARKGAASE